MKDAAEEEEVDEKTAIQIYQYCRDICSWRLLIHDSPLMLGGNGVVVQIDESLFRHKPKHHRGRATTNEVWVFGLCDTSQSPALGVMCIVPDCTAQTLPPTSSDATSGRGPRFTAISGQPTTGSSSCSRSTTTRH